MGLCGSMSLYRTKRQQIAQNLKILQGLSTHALPLFHGNSDFDVWSVDFGTTIITNMGWRSEIDTEESIPSCSVIPPAEY